jgi:LysM repeat protein
MKSLGQLGGGVLIAIISLVLVIGGISLALSEALPAQATPTPIPPTISLDFPTAAFTPSPVFAETSSPTATASATPLILTTDTVYATNTLFVQAACVPPSGWIAITTVSGDTIYALAQRYKTTPENISTGNCLSSFDVPPGFVIYVPPVPTVTVIPCGHPPVYVRYVVQRGDTLYSVATRYGISYPTLQRANCMGSSTTIYAGQLLWVPNIIIPTRIIPTPTSIIITFPSATPGVTLGPTATTEPPATSTTAPPPTAVPPTTAVPNTPLVIPTDTTSPQ